MTALDHHLVPSLALHYAQFRPHRQLASWVECYWHLSDDGVRADASEPPRPQRILPDGYVEIIVHRGDRFARVDVETAPVLQPRLLFVGQMIRPIRVLPTGRTNVWGVRLHPWAASVVAGMPAYELTGRIERTEDVCPRLARDLADALDEADEEGDVARGVQALERVLQWHLARAVPLDPLVVAAGGMLLRQPRPIGEMAARLGVSVRQLERAFQHTVGLTPKMFARISRFQRVAALLDGVPEEASAGQLASVALECGYYDQSHLVRDVRAFAGDTPVALRDALDGELAEYFLRARRASHFSKIDPAHVD